MVLPVLLWTDLLIFVLLAACAGYVFYVKARPHLSAPWRRVLQSPVAAGAGVVLGFVVLIGLLDSLHFRAALSVPATAARTSTGVGTPSGTAWSPEVTSVLDVLLECMASRKEKTYSAPLAFQAFSKENVQLPDGRQSREFPRLRYGGAHLTDPQRDWGADISIRVLRGIALAVSLWCLLTAMLLAACRAPGESIADYAERVWRGNDLPLALRGVFVALAAILLIACPAAFLAADYHVLGTDKVGQDVLYLALKGIRTALVIGTLTTLVTLPLAIGMGICAGYLRGVVDDVIQYVYTMLNSIPGVLLIAAAVLVLQVQIESRPELFPTAAQRADVRLLFLCIILGLTSWTGLCRLLRGETLKLREMEFVQAAKAFGVSDARIMLKHILPNVMHVVIIAIVMDFSGLVLAEAVLSYVGVGVDPTMISYGSMINAARLEMGREPMVWWSLASAFGFMLVIVLAANLLADAIRDAFDPRMMMVRQSSAGEAGPVATDSASKGRGK
jgi:peptide/nickel transport system permease protein